MRRQRGDIQGLRAVAVALVVLFHAGIPGFDGGYVGVDVFFVISGFLITTNLLEGLERTGRIGFAEFYARRARRLLPAALTVVALTVVAAAIWTSPLQLSYVFKEAIAATFYIPNILFAVRSTDYLGEKTPSLFLHYWSLGVEEQFYLVWPILLLFLFRFIKPRRRLIAAVVVLVLVSFAGCVWLTGVSQPYAFFLLPARAWEFGVGALCALALLHERSPVPPRLAAATGWIGLAGIAAGGTVLTHATTYPGYAVAIPVVGTALVIVGNATPTPTGPTALLSTRPFTYVGDISYSLYLIHWPALELPEAARGYMQPLPMWASALIALLCVPAAGLMYTFIEQPGRRARWLVNRRPRRTLAATAAGMALVTVLTAASSVVASRSQLDAGKAASATKIGPDPVGTTFVPNNLVPSLRNASSDNPAVYSNGCHRGYPSADASGCQFGDNRDAPLVALLGDSHAAQWFEPLHRLANEGRIRLDSNTKSACPAAIVKQKAYSECDIWRQAVIQRLAKDPPDVILLGNYATYYTSPAAYPEDDWRRAMLSTLVQLPSQSHVGIFADTPSTGVTPSMCLATFLDRADQCDLPREQALNSDARAAEESVVQGERVGYLDFTEFFCNEQNCPSIIGNTLVYRDGSHITATYSTELADEIMARIKQLRSQQTES